jgi:DNA-binding NarL/FixJ family response regulator
MNNPPITVSIVEDNQRVRDGLAAILQGASGFSLVSSCATAEEALRLIPRDRPDVVLMDIHLPRRSGIECVRQLRQQMPELQIIMLTIEEDSRRVFESLEAGATGYLVKHVTPARILAAIEEVNRGGSPVSTQIARLLVQSFQRRGPSARAEENLTPREEEILELIARGYRSKEVADELSISTQTVETHLRNIYSKLQVRSRAAAVARFLQREN